MVCFHLPVARGTQSFCRRKGVKLSFFEREDCYSFNSEAKQKAFKKVLYVIQTFLRFQAFKVFVSNWIPREIYVFAKKNGARHLYFLYSQTFSRDT